MLTDPPEKDEEIEFTIETVEVETGDDNRDFIHIITVEEQE